VDLPIENGGSFHSYVNVYQRVNSSNIQRWPSPCLVPALDGVSRVLGTSRDISGHGAAAFFRKMQLSAAIGDPHIPMRFHIIFTFQWEFQDPIYGGTVPYKAIFCGDIPLHRPLNISSVHISEVSEEVMEVTDALAERGPDPNEKNFGRKAVDFWWRCGGDVEISLW